MWIFSFAILSGSSLGVAKAWSNPSLSAPNGEPGPIVIALGGTQASSTVQDRSDLGAAASGANSDITSLSPSGNLILTPTSLDVGVNVSSPGYNFEVGGTPGSVAAGGGTAVMFGGQTPVSGVGGAGGMSFWGRPRIGDFGQWLQIGEITTPGDPILQITGSQVLTSVITTSTLGGGDTVHNVLDNGNGYVGILTTAPDQPLTVNGIIHSTSGGIEFPDGTVQTTAAGGSVANGSQTWTTPGTYTWTVPNGVNRLIIAEWGGGNSGGVWGSDDVGGTAGSFTLGFLSVNSGQSITIVVGAGGVNKGG